MKIIFFIVISLFACNAKIQNATEFGRALSEVAADVKAAKDILEIAKELTHSETSSTFQGGIQHSEGFSDLRASGDLVHSSVSVGRIPQLFILFKEFLEEDQLPETIAVAFTESLRMLAVSNFESENSDVVRSEIMFSKGEGHLVMYYLLLRPKDTSIEYYFTKVSAIFDLAPDYVVVRHTKKNFFSSSTKDEIVYLQRSLTSADITQIIQTIFSPIAAFLTNLLPLSIDI